MADDGPHELQGPDLARTKPRSRYSRPGRTIVAEAELDRRAQWVLDEMRRDPTLRAPELQAMVRDRFGCGIVASQNSVRRASNLLKEQFESITPEWIVDRYLDALGRAASLGRTNHERMILDSIAAFTGHAAPKKVALAVANVTPAQLAQLDEAALDEACAFQDGILERALGPGIVDAVLAEASDR